MKGGNNDLPFIKNSISEEDYLKSNITTNNNIKLDDSNLIKDLSLTVKDNENENNIKMNENESKEIKKSILTSKKLEI